MCALAWNSAFNLTPAGTDDRRSVDDRIREMKSELYKRLTLLFNFEADPDGGGYAFDLVDDVVKAGHLAADAVIAENIAANAVTTEKILDAAVTPAKLGSRTIVRAYLPTANQSVTGGQYTKITLGAEDFDALGEFDSTTNYRFTATEAGYYSVVGNIRWALSNADDKYAITMIYKNGAIEITGTQITRDSWAIQVVTAGIIYLDVGEYLELYGYHNATGAHSVMYGRNYTYMSIHRI